MYRSHSQHRPPPTKLRRELTTATEIRSLDFLGIPLLLLGIIGIVIALTWGDNTYAWGSSQVIAFLLLELLSSWHLDVMMSLHASQYDVLLTGFPTEAYGRTDGLIDHRFLQSRNFLLVLSVAFVDGMFLYGVNAFLPVSVGHIHS
jgi:hypothetical protein